VTHKGKAACLVVVGAAWLAGSDVLAQTQTQAQTQDQTQTQTQTGAWQDRGFIEVNVGVTQSHSYTETSTLLIYGEASHITMPRTTGSGPLIDAAGGVRVWRNLGVGVGYSYFRSSETTTLTAQVPNPAVFDSLRSATGSSGELSHAESDIHVQFLWMFPLSEKVHVAAILGPSFLIVSQDIITGLNLVEGDPPFSTVAISSAQTQKQSKTGVALTIGTDVSYFISPRWGVGGFLRYSRLNGGVVDIPSPDGSYTVAVPAGGVQGGGGVRYRF